ncbi:MAG TPA: hypothetical protein PLH23_03995 [Hyphomonadaceae bacterium]|nr:hypothetical protein [Hyphomonadaceae bacterium]HPI47405.1 hypothetical protein [Hyphomonadaceae bacterium]
MLALAEGRVQAEGLRQRTLIRSARLSGTLQAEWIVMAQDHVVASRTLTVSGATSREVVVELHQPAPDGNDYRCTFRIRGLEAGDIRSYAMGVDQIQALMLALQGIGVRLYTSDEGKAGQLSYLGHPNLDFPLPDGVQDLAPPPRRS